MHIYSPVYSEVRSGRTQSQGQTAPCVVSVWPRLLAHVDCTHTKALRGAGFGRFAGRRGPGFFVVARPCGLRARSVR